MRRTSGESRHLVMREVDAALTRPVPGEVAYVAGGIACQATVVDGDVEDAGAWTPVAYHSGAAYSSMDDALGAAVNAVVWLEGALKDR